MGIYFSYLGRKNNKEAQSADKKAKNKSQNDFKAQLKIDQQSNYTFKLCLVQPVRSYRGARKAALLIARGDHAAGLVYASGQQPLRFYCATGLPTLRVFPHRVIASASKARREAIQKKQRGPFRMRKTWIATRRAAARNDGGEDVL